MNITGNTPPSSLRNNT